MMVNGEVELVPPGPVHETERVVVWLSGPTACDPASARGPDHPPLAVHVVAFVEDQVTVTDAPAVTLV